MDGVLIGISTVLVSIFIFTLSLSWIVAQMAYSYSTRILDLYFGRTTKLFLALLLLNIAYPWIVMLWFSEAVKRMCTIVSLVSAFYCLIMLIYYILYFKENVRPETLVQLSLGEAKKELKELDKCNEETSPSQTYLYQLSQLAIAEEVLYKAIDNVNNSLIEYGFWQYLKYSKEIFSLKSISAYMLREHTINFLTSALIQAELTNKSLCFSIIHMVIGRMIGQTEKEKEEYLDFLGELKGGIWTMIEAESFVNTLPGTGTMKKQFIARCMICALFINAGWHKTMDISQEISFRQLLAELMRSKSKKDDYFEKNFQHAKGVIKQYRPELHKHLEPLKKMLEKNAEEELKKRSET